MIAQDPIASQQHSQDFSLEPELQILRYLFICFL